MEEPLIQFADLPWEEIAPGAREKAAQRDGKTVRLLQLDAGFKENEWCRRQHLGLVLKGTFEVAFANRVVTYQEGDAITIAAGDLHRHRAMVGDEPVTMFLIDPH